MTVQAHLSLSKLGGRLAAGLINESGVIFFPSPFKKKVKRLITG